MVKAEVTDLTHALLTYDENALFLQRFDRVLEAYLALPQCVPQGVDPENVRRICTGIINYIQPRYYDPGRSVQNEGVDPISTQTIDRAFTRFRTFITTDDIDVPPQMIAEYGELRTVSAMEIEISRHFLHVLLEDTYGVLRGRPSMFDGEASSSVWRNFTARRKQQMRSADDQGLPRAG